MVNSAKASLPPLQPPSKPAAITPPLPGLFPMQPPSDLTTFAEGLFCTLLEVTSSFTPDNSRLEPPTYLKKAHADSPQCFSFYFFFFFNARRFFFSTRNIVIINVISYSISLFLTLSIIYIFSSFFLEEETCKERERERFSIRSIYYLDEPTIYIYIRGIYKDRTMQRIMAAR